MFLQGVNLPIERIKRILKLVLQRCLYNVKTLLLSFHLPEQKLLGHVNYLYQRLIIFKALNFYLHILFLFSIHEFEDLIICEWKRLLKQVIDWEEIIFLEVAVVNFEKFLVEFFLTKDVSKLVVYISNAILAGDKYCFL